MHELSIADGVLGVVLAHAGDRRVTTRRDARRPPAPGGAERARVRLGAGDAGHGRRGRGAGAGARPGGGALPDCGAESEQDAFPLACAECGGLAVDVVRGEELLVDSLEWKDEEVMRIREGF